MPLSRLHERATNVYPIRGLAVLGQRVRSLRGGVAGGERTNRRTSERTNGLEANDQRQQTEEAVRDGGQKGKSGAMKLVP